MIDLNAGEILVVLSDTYCWGGLFLLLRAALISSCDRLTAIIHPHRLSRQLSSLDTPRSVRTSITIIPARQSAFIKYAYVYVHESPGGAHCGCNTLTQVLWQ